jgi:hypothetical protein
MMSRSIAIKDNLSSSLWKQALLTLIVSQRKISSNFSDWKPFSNKYYVKVSNRCLLAVKMIDKQLAIIL